MNGDPGTTAGAAPAAARTPRRVLAVDGGQSAIRLRHAPSGAAAEVAGVSRQEGDVVAAVARAVVQGWRAIGSPAAERVVLGLTTAPADPADQERLCTEVGAALDATEVWLADDAVTTHAGALPDDGGWGVSVTAGTGVACLAMPPAAGAPRIIGGHGFLLGDEGGGFWIGREGLRAALRAHDGRGPATPALDAAARARFGDLDDLPARLHAAPRPVNDLALFAPDVLAAADAGDPVAHGIADAAADELALLIRAGAAYVAAGPPATRAVPVALGGRLLAGRSSLRRRLDTRLAADPVPGTEPRDAAGTPLDGAMRLGLDDDPGRYGGLVVRWRRAT
ncbi:MAG: BadF/BadG/BcrA/BcrD ATPase family protein [Chloroflexota bacterium]